MFVPGSSVGIATGYGLDGPGIESARFSAPVQTDPGAHPDSCTMGTGSFPRVKNGRGVTLTLHPLLVPWSWKGRAIPLLPLWAVRPVQSLSACTRVHFTLLFIFVLEYSYRMTHRSVSHQIVLMTTLCVFYCFLSYTSSNTLSTLNVFVRMNWGLQCRGWPVDKLRAGVEPLIKRREDMTGDLDQSLRNLWSIKWCLNLSEYSVAIQNANTSEESEDTCGRDIAPVSAVALVQ
jgi:hypothetical protein